MRSAVKMWAGGKKQQLFPWSQTLNSYPFQFSSLLANRKKTLVLLDRCECVCVLLHMCSVNLPRYMKVKNCHKKRGIRNVCCSKPWEPLLPSSVSQFLKIVHDLFCFLSILHVTVLALLPVVFWLSKCGISRCVPSLKIALPPRRRCSFSFLMSSCLQLSDLCLLAESHICQSGVEKCNTATYCAQRELQTSCNQFLILCLCVRIALRKGKKLINPNTWYLPSF